MQNVLNNLRDKAGLTQTDLAKKPGVSGSAVNSGEMSLSFPSTANIIEMTKISLDFIDTRKLSPTGEGFLIFMQIFVK